MEQGRKQGGACAVVAELASEWAASHKASKQCMDRIGGHFTIKCSKVEVYASKGATNTAVACSNDSQSLYVWGKLVGLHMAAWFGR